MLSLRFVARISAVWRRNFLVWRKLALPSILGNLADPMIYMLGLGYGIGAMVKEIDGVPYIAFLAAGTVCYSTMNSATFEALYSAFSRMHVQRSWDAMLNAPLTLEDVVIAEWVWAASKSFLSGAAILLVVAVMGFIASPLALWVLALIPLVGLCFAALGLIITALAPSYDFFMYYFTLAITPMVLLCGVFFPVEQLPQGFQMFTQILPLTHAIALARPLMLGHVPESIVLHVAVLAAYAVVALAIALALFRRRLLK